MFKRFAAGTVIAVLSVTGAAGAASAATEKPAQERASKVDQVHPVRGGEVTPLRIDWR